MDGLLGRAQSADMRWLLMYGIPPPGRASVHETLVLRISQDPADLERWRLWHRYSVSQGLILFEPDGSRLCHQVTLVSMQILFFNSTG